MTLKRILPGYEALLTDVKRALGPERKPLLIAIDGADGIGKSSLASWLGWQLGMPVVYLDLHIIRDSEPLKWRTEEINRMIDSRLIRDKPIIVEGVFVLNVLQTLSFSPDYLIFVRGEGSHLLSKKLTQYFSAQNPVGSANFCIDGFSE